VNKNKRKCWQARKPRRNSTPSLFELMTPAESRKARAIACKAALAVIG
jgi:hypothetical protein